MPEDLDIDGFNEAETPVLSQQPVHELIESLRRTRLETLQLTSTLEESDLLRVANHPWFGEKEMVWLLKLLFRHQLMHLYDVRKALETRAPVPHTERFREV